MIKKFHFQKADGGIEFIGFDDEKRIYSTSYLANCNGMDSTSVKRKEIRKLEKACIELGYKQATYLNPKFEK